MHPLTMAAAVIPGPPWRHVARQVYVVNSLNPYGRRYATIFLSASCELDNFFIFCPLTTFDS